MDDGWHAKYQAHIRSAKWRNMRNDMLRLRNNRCERCTSQYNLELHHKTYERLGRELIADLELLCHRCHEQADIERATQGRIRSAQARYYAALNTYATKKYGDDWVSWGDDGIAEEFNQWIEARRDEWP